MLPELPALLRPDLPARARTRSSPLLCVEAYNDWMVDEWCGESDGRLIPLCLVPAVGRRARGRRGAAQRRARRARGRVHRAARRGSGCPSIHSGYWDPFFAACAETGTVVCMHIGSGTKTLQTSSDAPDAVPAHWHLRQQRGVARSTSCSRACSCATPTSSCSTPSAQIGWIPYVLERVDDVWDTHRGWADSQDARHGAAVDLLLPPGLQLLLQGPRRREAARPGRRRQRLLRDRLPAPGRHVAAHREGRRRDLRPPPRRRRSTRSCAATPSSCWAWTSIAVSRAGHGADLPSASRRNGSRRTPSRAGRDAAPDRVATREVDGAAYTYARARSRRSHLGRGVSPASAWTPTTTSPRCCPTATRAHAAWLGLGWLRRARGAAEHRARRLAAARRAAAQRRHGARRRRGVRRTGSTTSTRCPSCARSWSCRPNPPLPFGVPRRRRARGRISTGPTYRDIAVVLFTSGTTGPSKAVLTPWAVMYQFWSWVPTTRSARARPVLPAAAVPQLRVARLQLRAGDAARVRVPRPVQRHVLLGRRARARLRQPPRSSGR